MSKPKRRSRAVCGGNHPSLEEAEAALARLPPPGREWSARQNRAAEQRRLRTVLPENTDLTGVYADATGWVCRPWLNGRSVYVGHFADVESALSARDAAVINHSIPNTRPDNHD